MAYDLLTEPWIPVVFTDGRRRHVGISDALDAARRIRRVEGDTGWQAACILRLLIAIASVARGDTAGYLATRGDRFDLHHPERPFMQIPALIGRRHSLDDLQSDSALYPRGVLEGPAEVARWLVTAHQYDPSGIKPAASGDTRAKAGKSYPVGAWLIDKPIHVLHGPTLADTIALHLLPGDPGTPVWDRDPDIQYVDRTPTGTADLLTWQARRIHIGADDDMIVFTNGLPASVTAATLAMDPMIAAITDTPTPGSGTRRRRRRSTPEASKPLRYGTGLSDLAWHRVARAATASWPAAATRPLGITHIEIIAPHTDLYRARVDDIDAPVIRTRTDILSTPEAVVDIADTLAALVTAFRLLDRNLQAAAGSLHPIAKADVALLHDLEPIAQTAFLASPGSAWLSQAIDVTRRHGKFLITSAPTAAWIGRSHNGTLISTNRAEGWFRAQLAKIGAGGAAARAQR